MKHTIQSNGREFEVLGYWTGIGKPTDATHYFSSMGKIEEFNEVGFLTRAEYVLVLAVIPVYYIFGKGRYEEIEIRPPCKDEFYMDNKAIYNLYYANSDFPQSSNYRVLKLIEVLTDE